MSSVISASILLCKEDVSERYVVGTSLNVGLWHSGKTYLNGDFSLIHTRSQYRRQAGSNHARFGTSTD